MCAEYCKLNMHRNIQRELRKVGDLADPGTSKITQALVLKRNIPSSAGSFSVGEVNRYNLRHIKECALLAAKRETD